MGHPSAQPGAPAGLFREILPPIPPCTSRGWSGFTLGLRGWLILGSWTRLRCCERRKDCTVCLSGVEHAIKWPLFRHLLFDPLFPFLWTLIPGLLF